MPRLRIAALLSVASGNEMRQKHMREHARGSVEIDVLVSRAEMAGGDRQFVCGWHCERQVHGCTIGRLFVARDKFVVQFDVDLTDKASGKRAKMPELGIYTGKDGRITREEFLPHAQSED
jgi:hypothetical protein